jgi:hypothetical protein
LDHRRVEWGSARGDGMKWIGNAVVGDVRVVSRRRRGIVWGVSVSMFDGWDVGLKASFLR